MRLSFPTTMLLAALFCISPAWADGPVEKTSKPGTYNKAVVAFCQAQLDKKVGSGECSHLANEALRVAGAEFINDKFGDEPNRGDYVWGLLVKRLSWDGDEVVDSSPKAKCQPGDIIQFRDAAFPGATAPHHTSIVAVVDGKGWPTEHFEQNARGKREVMKGALDFTKLKGGWARIYRPSKPRVNPRQPTEFTLLNRTDKVVSFTFGGKQQTIDEYDTMTGFKTWRFGGMAVLVVGRAVVIPKHRKGYEIYQSKEGKIALREVK